MAYLNVTSASAPALTTRLRAGLTSIATRYKQYRLYRETLDGLGALSDRELNDLGLHRSELRRIAQESARK